MPWGLKDAVSVVGLRDGSDGLWNSKCAMDLSIGFVSVSISINPVHLKKKKNQYLELQEKELIGRLD